MVMMEIFMKGDFGRTKIGGPAEPTKLLVMKNGLVTKSQGRLFMRKRDDVDVI